MYDDFYEPSDYDIMIEELKEKLRESVKQEYVDEMNRLKDEVGRLSDIKKNWNEKCKELDDAKRDAERTKREALSQAKKMRLGELLNDYIIPAWGLQYDYKYLREKCDKCDEDGRIHYKSPQGYDRTEECDCRKKVYVWTPVEAEIVEISRNKWAGSDKVPYYVYFEWQVGTKGEYRDDFRRTTTFADDLEFEKVDPFGMVFRDKEKAEAYCEWRNKRMVPM